MKDETTRHTYEIGQRWEFKSNVPVCETQLVIGSCREVTSYQGKQERFEVYIPFAETAREALPPQLEGQILSLSAADLDRNVTTLIESNVELPFWWRCGYRVESIDRMPFVEGIVCCEVIPETLSLMFERLKERYAYEQKKLAAMQNTREKLKNLGPPKRSCNVAESWQRLAAFMKNIEEEFPINDGASEVAIKNLETLIGSELPDDFRESLRLHDGGNWWVLPNFGELLPIAEIERQWSMYKDWQERGEYASSPSDWDVRDTHGPIRPIFWNRKRIPITDNSGDHLMLDLDPPADGAYGQILDHSHEVGPQRVVASSWTEFLANLVEDIESGQYTYDSAARLKRIDDPNDSRFSTNKPVELTEDQKVKAEELLRQIFGTSQAD